MTTTTERTPERQQFLVDILTTACEGGINYWCFLDSYDIWENPKAPTAELVLKKDPQLRLFDMIAAEHLLPDDREELFGDVYWKNRANELGWEALPQEYCYTLNADVIELGLQRAWQQQLDQPGSYWGQLKIAWLTSGRDGDYDADLADQVVQLGLFDKGVYG